MAEITRYIDSASSAGGDGTTSALEGANRAYASLTEWEAGENTDLVADGDTHIAIVACGGGAAFSESLTIYGWNTGVSNTLKLWTEPAGSYRHAGIWDASKVRVSGPTGDESIYINEDYVTIAGLQIEHDVGTASTDAGVWIYNKSNCVVDSCIIRGCDRGFYFEDTNDGIHIIKNNIIYDCYREGIFLEGGSGFDSFVVNNTVYGCNTSNTSYRDGICTDYCVVKNNISVANLVPANSADYDADNIDDSDYNMSDDATAPTAGNSIINVTSYDTATAPGSDEACVVFKETASGSEDLRLDGNQYCDAIGGGIGTTDGDIPTTDIVGTARASGTCDLGAFEFASAATPRRIIMSSFSVATLFFLGVTIKNPTLKRREFLNPTKWIKN